MCVCVLIKFLFPFKMSGIVQKGFLVPFSLRLGDCSAPYFADSNVIHLFDYFHTFISFRLQARFRHSSSPVFRERTERVIWLFIRRFSWKIPLLDYQVNLFEEILLSFLEISAWICH